MIACLAAGAMDLLVLAVTAFMGQSLTHARSLALWLGIVAVFVAGSSLLKARAVARTIENPK